MEDDFLKLFSLQLSCIKIKEYQNEYDTMRAIFDRMPAEPRQLVQGLSLLWLQSLEKKQNMEFELKENSVRTEKSRDLRLQGNRLFTAKGSRNVLGACRFYTSAIYAAIDTDGNELALAFANRAAGLQSFGYYQQAYDDCVCALKLGYPKSLRHKVIKRQAYCSIKMNDLKKAESHLCELRELNSSVDFSTDLNELIVAFDELKTNPVDNGSNNIKLASLNRETQEIISTQNEGRCMLAKCVIEKDQRIFTERASALVPIGDTHRLCHECGTVNFIPIPCIECRGTVNYCSLKCQKEHRAIHVHECAGYRMQLFNRVGIAHLALRIILDDGLLAILDELKLEEKSSTIEVWHKLREGGDIWNSNNIKYAESLRMISHLDKISNQDIEWYALVSHLLVVYLKHYSKYFENLNALNKNIDWELLTGSLILLHIGQSISNGHILITIIPLPLMTTMDFHMLNENLWSSPWHLKLGFLHIFSNYDDVGSLNLPYLSLCNHSCVQMFQIKFSGRFISTYSMRKIHKGEEITNCYDVDYRKSKRKARRKKLEENYHFVCKCENCLQASSEDVEFNKYYQYRCDNAKCGEIFTASKPENQRFDLLQNELLHIVCTVCGHEQNLNWYHESMELMTSFMQAKARRRLHDIFKESAQYLIDLNEDRCYFAQQLLCQWFTLFGRNINLSDQEYCYIIEVIKYILKVTRMRSSINSIEYITHMTFLWDLIAKRKYKCSAEEMDEMLAALNIVSDDLKLIFINYYSDYIKVYLNV